MKFKQLFCKLFGHKLLTWGLFDDYRKVCVRCGQDFTEDYTFNGLPKFKNPPPKNGN